LNHLTAIVPQIHRNVNNNHLEKKMSYGKMNTLIEILTTKPIKDAEGFATTGDTVLANVRAYFEPKNTTEKWRNNAAFAEATALFRFRAIPGIVIDSTIYIICGGDRYRVISAEDVRGRHLYWEILAQKVEGSVY
jgi:head-tail adaptor